MNITLNGSGETADILGPTSVVALGTNETFAFHFNPAGGATEATEAGIQGWDASDHIELIGYGAHPTIHIFDAINSNGVEHEKVVVNGHIIANIYDPVPQPELTPADFIIIA